MSVDAESFSSLAVRRMKKELQYESDEANDTTGCLARVKSGCES